MMLDDDIPEDMVQVGTWLLPKDYGNDYDHFTPTRMPSNKGKHVALFAKREDLKGSGFEYLGVA